MKSAIHEKVGVKIVYGALVHRGTHEGPCRTGDKKSLSLENERRRAKEEFANFVKEVEENINKENAELLEPVYIEYFEDFIVKESEFKKLEKDLENVDLFLLKGRVPGIERYKKPVCMIGKGVTNVDVSAYMRSRGFEGYAIFDFNHLNDLIYLLKVRKSIKKTKILRISGGEEIPWGVVSSIYDFEKLKEKYGTEVKTVLFDEFFEEMEEIEKKGKEEAEKIYNKLVKEAVKVHMKKEDIIGSIYFYLTARSLMEKFNCNAFTCSCFELCSTQIPEKKKFTPCLTHTLLKDEGFPSSCEEDISVLLGMAILMYLSKKSSYMGNPYVVDKNILRIIHDVPGIKMKGLDKEPLQYEIRNFTVAGWGVNIRYDFSQDKGEKVTLARFDPLGEKILVVKGEILKGLNFNEIGCSLGVEIKVSDAMEYFNKAGDFGHHLAMVYGDYTEKIKKLARLMDFEVVEV